MSNVQHELSSLILPSCFEDNYFTITDLPPTHVKPLTAHGFWAFSFAATTLAKKASESWHGRAISVLARATAITGQVTVVLFAVVETLGSLGISLLVFGGYWATGSKSEYLKNHLIKTLSYSTHCVVLIAVQVIFLCKKTFSQHYSINSLLTNCTHLATYAFVTSIIREIFDSETDCQSKEDRFYEMYVRLARAFVQNGATVDLLYALDRDFGFGATNDEFKAQLETQSLINFGRDYPFYKHLFMQFNIFSPFDDSYMESARDMAANFVRYSYGQQVINVPQADTAGDIVYDTNSKEEKEYQRRLGECVKVAYKEIHGSEKLSSYLEGGRKL